VSAQLDLVEALTRASIDLDDKVSLAEFSDLEWERIGGDAARRPNIPATRDNRYSWMRTQLSRRRSQGEESGLPRRVASPRHSTAFLLGDLIAWIEQAGHRRVRYERDWKWALLRAATAYLDRPGQPVPEPDELGHTAIDNLRHFLVGLILLCAPNGDLSALDSEIIDVLLAPGPPISTLAAFRELAQRRQLESDHVAIRLMAAANLGYEEVIRCARATVAGLFDAGKSPGHHAFDLSRELRKLSARSGTRATDWGLAALMCSLADLSAFDVVVDPACGEGQLLLGASFSAESSSEEPLTLVGRDNSEACTDTARAYFYLEDAAADTDIQTIKDSLSDVDQFPRADVVLLDPPLVKGVHVRRWLTLATQICPNGRVVTVLPGNSLRPGRREWLEVRHRVLAVIACPPNTKSDTGEAPAVWLLGKENRTGSVLVVDARQITSNPLDRVESTILAGQVNEWVQYGVWNASPLVPADAQAYPREVIDKHDGELRLKELPDMVNVMRAEVREDPLDLDPAKTDDTSHSVLPLARTLLSKLLSTKLPDSPPSALEQALYDFLRGTTEESDSTPWAPKE
jgi:N-6 DNA Methylase